MTNHKFTDEQIIKALECCANTLECRNCPLIDEDNCTYRNINYVLDLTNRQRAEIERLKSMNQAKLDMIHDLRTDLEQAKAEAIKEFAERVKENRTRIFNTIYSEYHFGEIIDTLVKEMTEGGEQK